ncbi:type I-E CRISPR-associated endoribonuclease Cas2e [Oerskovia sp. KBS0722]|uniref:type I-E CRISPR-associated endoribonuclease Cas2e n=1 Tax=Oerskovia sp. KBS0722 TaxID=1179673 RepID=UPI001AEF98D5|nr:type I-E CRISPR-associated endoribonuclease Cas2e [Oerskovia sp. KBS0722]
MIVVVLSVCPEKLRGELTRWLLEVSAGVYVGHVPARVRDMLWLRIVEDVARGRALMIHTARNEQGMSLRVHNHAWEAADHEGLVLMRRQTAESRALATERKAARQQPTRRPRTDVPDDGDAPPHPTPGRTWSHAGRRRRYRNSIERRRGDAPNDEPEPPP